MLTQLQIKNAKPKDRPYKMADGHGLTLLVQVDGSKFWRLRFRYGGKEQMLSLGEWPHVSLSDARQQRDEARAELRASRNPAVLRKQARARAVTASANTFRALSGEWIELCREEWSASHLKRIQSQLDRDILPALGERPVTDIIPPEVLAVAKRVEARGSLTMARRCLERMAAIFSIAVQSHRLTVSPAREFLEGKGLLKTRTVKHRASLPFDQLPTFFERFDALTAGDETKGALEMLLLTATRSGEVRGMRWDELDLNDKAPLWRIPAARMKMDSEHLVPLSRQAVDILRRLQPLTGKGELVFPSPQRPKQPLTANALLMALWRMGYEKGEITAHGFRATFSTTMNEKGHDPDVIERVLAHVERNKVRAAYHRAQYLDQRRTLLQEWADMVDAKRKGANVTPIRRNATKVSQRK